MACDSEEAAKQSRSASKEILPIVVGVVVAVAIVAMVAVSIPGAAQNWYNRNVERIMVRHTILFSPSVYRGKFHL